MNHRRNDLGTQNIPFVLAVFLFMAAVVGTLHAQQSSGNANDNGSQPQTKTKGTPVDSGPRPGAPGAGSFYPTLNANEQAYFESAFGRFQEVDSVSGGIEGESGSGLGPTFNGNS